MEPNRERLFEVANLMVELAKEYEGLRNAEAEQGVTIFIPAYQILKRSAPITFWDGKVWTGSLATKSSS